MSNRMGLIIAFAAGGLARIGGLIRQLNWDSRERGLEKNLVEQSCRPRMPGKELLLLRSLNPVPGTKSGDNQFLPARAFRIQGKSHVPEYGVAVGGFGTLVLEDAEALLEFHSQFKVEKVECLGNR